MVRSQRITAAAIAVALVFAGALGAFMFTGSDGTSAVQAQEQFQERGISVQGEGQISVAPDIAKVVLGVEVEGADLDTLRDDADSRMNDIVDALQDLGVAEEDIRTITYDIRIQNDDMWPPRPATEPTSPDSDDDDNGDISDEDEVIYVIVQQVQVRVADIDIVGEVIDTALDSGANRVSRIWFEVEDRQEAIEQARELAVEHARDKAEHLADLTGVGLGAPLRIDESSPSLPPIRAAEFDMEAAETDDAMARIEPGESVITVSVYITYDID